MAKTPKLRLVKPAPCPICGKPRAEQYRPFCSRRCADIDMGRWLKEGYAIPTEETPDEPEPGAQSEPPPRPK
ncbi:MAG: DNA gyrase inhibitor YacG [Reyranellaceae bacterium]